MFEQLVGYCEGMGLAVPDYGLFVSYLLFDLPLTLFSQRIRAKKMKRSLKK